MFGQNKIMKLDHGDGSELHVVNGSPFLTVQGEGPFAGMPAVFIRLHGCHLRCTFCDTDFDSPDDTRRSTVSLVEHALRIRGKAKLAVITGGEPMRQNILRLCKMLSTEFQFVQVETAGTFWIDGIEDYADIVCSPKTPTINPMIKQHAMAFKYVISGEQTFSGGPYGFVPTTATQPGARPAQLALPNPDGLIYLSPCDEKDESKNAFNRNMVARLAIEYGVIAGLQLHKFFDVD